MSEQRWGGLPLRGTRIHKVKKDDFLEQLLDKEIKEALMEWEQDNVRTYGREGNSGMENNT